MIFLLYNRHFKGTLHEIICVARDSETLEEKVIYRALYGDNKLWVRSKNDFLSEVGERQDNLTNQKYKFEVVEE